jgi:hypothetical protein
MNPELLLSGIHSQQLTVLWKPGCRGASRTKQISKTFCFQQLPVPHENGTLIATIDHTKEGTGSRVV